VFESRSGLFFLVEGSVVILTFYMEVFRKAAMHEKRCPKEKSPCDSPFFPTRRRALMPER
jgi:hypothetical protein